MPNVADVLQKKIGPLPVAAWAVVVGGGVWFARRVSSSDEETISPTEVTDAYGEAISFPAGQLVPITGDEHLAPSGPITIPAPPEGGVVIVPGLDEPIVFNPAPLPPPDEADPPPTPAPTIPTISYFGQTWTKDMKWNFLHTWKIRRRDAGRNWGVSAWNTWLLLHLAIKKFFGFTGTRTEWNTVGPR